MSRREWTVEDLFGQTWRFHVDPHGSTGDTGLARNVIDTLSHTSLMRPPQRGDRVAETLFELFAHLERPPFPDPSMQWDAAGDEGRAGLTALREALLRNADTGRLRVERIEVHTQLHYEREAPPSERKPREAETDAWVAIELVDEDNRPMANVEYRLEGPSGDTYTGTTDAAGHARVNGLKPGICKLSLPRTHGPDWRKVG